MFTTVHFATNRALTGPANDWRNYGSTIVAPSDPTAMTYATAFVDNTNLTADTTGSIGVIQNVQQGGFSHLMSFFANLEPLIQHARSTGNRVFLLAHSMGNLALQAAVESWFSHGN